MRKFLDAIYIGTAVMGAFFVVVIGLLICAQVVGRQIGVQVKGADDLIAWSVVAAGFLPLAYTFRNGRHIRVTLFIDKARRARRSMELTVLCIAQFFVAYLAYSSIDMVLDSIRFDDLSQGLINIPLWIPQISIPVGSAILTIAILDEIFTLLMGAEPSYMCAAAGEEPGNVDKD